MASRFSVEPVKLLETLRATVFQNATNEELLALTVVANQYGLNPFTREIYAFPKKGGGIQPVISIDGWLCMMNSHPQFDGIEYEFSGEDDDTACTATVHVKGRSKPVRVTEYLTECRRNTDPWNTYPRRMLRHKTTIQAARVAFGFSGALDEDAVNSGEVIDTVVLPAEPKKPEPNPSDQSQDKKEPHQELADVVTSAGHTFDQFRAWLIAGKHVSDADALSGYEDLPPTICQRLLRGKAGMIAQLKGGLA